MIWVGMLVIDIYILLGIMYRNMFVLIDRLKKIYVDKEIIV